MSLFPKLTEKKMPRYVIVSYTVLPLDCRKVQNFLAYFTKFTNSLCSKFSCPKKISYSFWNVKILFVLSDKCTNYREHCLSSTSQRSQLHPFLAFCTFIYHLYVLLAIGKGMLECYSDSISWNIRQTTAGIEPKTFGNSNTSPKVHQLSYVVMSIRANDISELSVALSIPV